ncbi:MAG: hypothetical protein JXA57_13780 [Armatimonadetes bacterium]|nr:hypothetical protein [Armatimonadota bacterium]
MSRLAVALLLLFPAVLPAAGEPAVSLEVGADSVVFGSVEDSGQLLDGVVVRLAASFAPRPDVSVGPVLAWRYQSTREQWSSFTPSGGVWFEGRGDPCDPGGFASFYEVTVRLRVLDQDPGLHPLIELEGGFAVIDEEEGVAGDAIISARFGAAWRFRTGLSASVGIGERLYFASERYTVPVTFEVGVGL